MSDLKGLSLVPDTQIYRRQSGRAHEKSIVGPRDSSRCEIKQSCGLCLHVNLPYLPCLQKKHQVAIDKLHASGSLRGSKVLGPKPSDHPLAYRQHIKLAVRKGENSRFQLGLFKPTTHDIVDVSHCPVHSPSLGRLIRALKVCLEESHLTPYDESSNEGDIRYIAARSAHLTGEIMLTFVVTREIKGPLKAMVNRLRDLGHVIKSAAMNINAEVGNQIFGPETKPITGVSRLRERICDLDLEVSPTSFFQINPWEAQRIYHRIEQMVGTPSPEDVAIDFFSGTGITSLLFARLGYQVLSVEENVNSVADAQDNARRNALAENIHFLTSRVEDLQSFPDWASHPQVIFVNPSRRGIAEPARAAMKNLIAQSSNTKLIYMSCEAETLERDLLDIRQCGIKLRQLEAFDMFPQTNKLEWLAYLSS